MLTPTITSSLSAGCLEPGWCAREFVRSKALLERVLTEGDGPVRLKYTLPGPMTMLDQLIDGYYGGDLAGRAAAADDLVGIINKVA